MCNIEVYLCTYSEKKHFIDDRCTQNRQKDLQIISFQIKSKSQGIFKAY